MNPTKSASDQLFVIVVKNRTKIISLFKLLYLVLFVFLIFGGYNIYAQTDLFALFYSLAVSFGRIGLVLYCITTVPGISRRFKIQHRLIQIIMIFRRYIGIMVFLSITIHYWFQRGISIFFMGELTQYATFELVGVFAYFLLLFMFMTSNDFSTKHMGKWWGRLHMVTYVVVWLVFFHTFLQRISLWSILAVTTLFLQMASWAYHFSQKRQAVVVAPQNPINT